MNRPLAMISADDKVSRHQNRTIIRVSSAALKPAQFPFAINSISSQAVNSVVALSRCKTADKLHLSIALSTLFLGVKKNVCTI
ncbi:MAG: hypothetical protein HY254_04495 [Burkholderiales bacterium]|nr:hypothetical protein [Burkholderiales bacterium]